MQNEKSLRVLEWQTILEHLSKHAVSEMGKERCLNLVLFDNVMDIKREITHTTEAKNILDKGLNPPIERIKSVKEAVVLSKVTESLRNIDLIDIAKSLRVSRLLKSFFSRQIEEAAFLYEMSIMLFENAYLEDEILSKFDDAANMLDDASFELKKLKNSLKDQTKNLKDRLNGMIHSLSKYLQEPVYTSRDDRYVLPVKIEHKAHVHGIIHDVSTSGATVFIEPKAIVELNNKLRETEIKIEHEIKRILAELTQKVGEYADEIAVALDLLADFDFVFAKAKYSIELKAIEPDLNNKKIINVKAIRHPILLKVLDNVVPNDIVIGENFNSLIITGSNTGGKTVVLKAAGLCVLMAKAGLHIPAAEANIYPFKQIFADIGDEQSVIQSLSTFSGHMTNIISIVDNVDDDSLVVLDEIGAGTDPSEGSALAQAILENLQLKGVRTIVTTHYGELKALAYTKEGFENASVQFDTSTLSPTYKLLIGIPGASNAITIAKNLGLKDNIAQQAQEIFYSQKDYTGSVIEGLQNTQHRLDKETTQAEVTREALEKLEEEYKEKLEKIRAERKKTIDIFKKKYETSIAQARSEIKHIVEEIRISKSEKLSRRAFLRLAEIEASAGDSFRKDFETAEPEFEPINWETVKIGDTIFIKDLKKLAELLSLPDKNNNVQVQIGTLKINVKTSKLAKTDKKMSTEAKKQRKNGGFSFSRTTVGNTLDLRGSRVEDGLDQVEKYLDEACLSNFHSVYIIHGHGTGALRQAVREYLSTSPYVAKFRSGESSEGGDGVSVIDLA
jgi:DNA mismatch repair protein MutS2